MGTLDRTVVTASIREFVLTELMGTPDYPLGVDEPLITGGLIDSLSLAYLAVHIEETFDVYVPDVELTTEDVDTVARLTDLVLVWQG